MVWNVGLNHTHGGNIKEIAVKYGLRTEDIVDFSASINPLGVSRRAKKAVIDQFDSVLHYPEQFADTLISEIAKFHGVPEECIIAGNGSTELIYLIPRVIKPKRALIVIPAFSEYRNALDLIGCETVGFLLSPDTGFKLEQDQLAAVLRKRFDILYICNPGNPTGSLFPVDTILKIVDEACVHGTLCVVDEAFIDFAESESAKGEAVVRPNLIVLRSLTKFFGIPGMRVGFAISNKENVGKMMVYKEPWSVNALGSIAAIESLRDDEYMEESRRYTALEGDFIFSSLSQIPWLKAYPAAANYILVRIDRDGMDADALFRTLVKEGIIIRSCSSFEGLGNMFFRVAVRTRVENIRLLNMLRLA